jgi:cell division protein ZapE
MPGSLRDRYAALVASGRIEPDAAQDAAVLRLGDLAQRLEAQKLARKSSSLGWMFGNRERASPVKGLYVFGDVGRGKTMLMDLFFESVAVERKRRVHFHEFMAEMHERVFELRKQPKNAEDAVLLAGDAIARETSLLCFDEFHVTDIADAMILARLFKRMFDAGVIVVATSNVAPDDLYRNGLNRALFLPFIATLKEHMDVLRLEARTDYRLEKLVRGKVWHAPDDASADAALADAWSRITMGNHANAIDLVVKGHTLHVPQAAHGAARFSFRELCGIPLGASDYLRIAREFHTLVIDHVPVMDFDRRNEAKRFITLIDALYDHAVKLVASAQAGPHELYSASDGYEAAEFQRTASRLIEMGSQSYLALPHGVRAADGASGKIIET